MDECSYKEWIERSEELWRQRSRDFLGDEYTRLLAIAVAAKAFIHTEWAFNIDHCPPSALDEHDKLVKALAAVEDLL